MKEEIANELVLARIKKMMREFFLPSFVDTYWITRFHKVMNDISNFDFGEVGVLTFKKDPSLKTDTCLSVMPNEQVIGIDFIISSKYIINVKNAFVNNSTYENYLKHDEYMKKLCALLFPDDIRHQGLAIIMQDEFEYVGYCFRYMIILNDGSWIQLYMTNNSDIHHDILLKKEIQKTIIALIGIEYEISDINLDNMAEIGQLVKTLRY